MHPQSTLQPQPDGISLLMVNSLGERRGAFVQQAQKCGRSASEKSIHDLRVATRRLVEVLRIAGLLSDEAKAAKVRGSLKKTFDRLSPLRDTHVQLQLVEGMMPSFPEVQSLTTMLKLREQRLVKHARAQIGRIDIPSLNQSIAAISHEIEELLQNPAVNQAARHALVGMATAAFLKAVHLRRTMDPMNARTIHKLRVAFKKYRYKAEVLALLLAGVSKHSLKQMNAYQTMMGDIQDLEIAQRTAKGFLRKTGGTRRYSRFIRELTRRKNENVAAFLHQADILDSLSPVWPNPGLQVLKTKDD